MIKRISNTLVDRYERSLSTEFEPNKQFLKEIGLDVSKKLRNKIAGYVTRIMKFEATHRGKMDDASILIVAAEDGTEIGLIVDRSCEA